LQMEERQYGNNSTRATDVITSLLLIELFSFPLLQLNF
jgi:hypothetical protein